MNRLILSVGLASLTLSSTLASAAGILNLSQSEIGQGTDVLVPALDNKNLVSQPDLTVRMGQGYNSLGGLKYSQDLAYCVEKNETRTFGSSPGESISIFLDNISSEEEFATTVMETKNFTSGLSMNQPLGEKGDKLNLFSFEAQAKGKTNRFNHYDKRYSYAYVEVRKNFEAEILNDFAIPRQRIDFFSSRPQEFFKKCGDRFVSGVKKGAEVLGVLRCEAGSKEEKRNIDQMIKLSAGYKAFTAQGEVTKTLEDLKKMSHNNCQLIVSAQGGQGQYDIKDSSNFLASAIQYVSSATPATAKPLEFITNSYDSIVDLDFSANVIDKIDLKLEKQHAFIEKKSSQIGVNIKMLRMLSDIGPANEDALREGSLQITQFMSQIEACIKDPMAESSCREQDSKIKLPRPKSLSVPN